MAKTRAANRIDRMIVRDLGRLEYLAAWDVQLEVAAQVEAGGDDTLLFVEHPAVLTLGANFHQENLLHSIEFYERMGISVRTTDRGGDVTYHGPDQLVVYPIFNLRRHGQDLHRWIRGLEEAILVAVAEFGIEGRRFPPHTGVWVGDRKLAAIGIKVRKWVSLHGIALNCSNDLAVFDLIVPCGIRGYGVTSLTEETGRPIGPSEAKPAVAAAFAATFAQNG